MPDSTIQSDVPEVTHGESVTKRRRGDRGWGPFSGGQLTVIIVTFAVMMLVPVGAWAVVNSNVAITDPGGVNRAKVNPAGQLSVIGPDQALPTATYNAVEGATEFGGCDNVTNAVPSGKALVVTSITVVVTELTTGPVTVSIETGTSTGACGSGGPLNITELAGVGSTEFIPFPSGLVFEPGHKVSVRLLLSGSGDAVVNTSVHGYLVSSTLCGSASADPVGCH